MNLHPYAKAVVAVLAAALYALQAALTDGGVTAQEWVGIAVAAVAAIGVYAVPNETPDIRADDR